MRTVDGYSVRFTGRTSWTVEILLRGKVVATAPVAWSKDFKPGRDGHDALLRVNFQDEAELLTKLFSTEAFVVAVAVARDYSTIPHSVQDITALFRVISTGRRTSDKSIECRVLERVNGTSRQIGQQG